MHRLLIYGATGFTGRLIVHEALSRGLRPTLAGRTPSSLEGLARMTGLSYRVAPLEEADMVSSMLRQSDVLLNAAGPFDETALRLARACIEHSVHYMDITGDFSVIESLANLDNGARRRGVMVMPAVGFDVVASDCMAALAARRLPEARSLSIALSGLNAISRGSAESVFRHYGDLVMVRRRGRLVRLTPGTLARDFDFGQGPSRALAVTWADISSAYYTTGIPDITGYYEATPIAQFGLWLSRYAGSFVSMPRWESLRKDALRWLPEGPTSAQRSRGRAVVVVEAMDDRKCSFAARLTTPEVYSFTATTSVAILQRVMADDFDAGFQTPARVYGPEYVLSLPGVTCSPLS